MDLPEFLQSRNIALPAVVSSAQSSLGLGRADALLAVGSLVEGLGNSKSDLDLLLITARDSSTLPGHVALAVGKSLFDIEILPLPKLEELLARFATWAAAPWDITRTANISPADQKLLHRLLHRTILFEGDERQVAGPQPARADLARLKLHIARNTSRTIQVDMVGNAEVDDYASLIFAAQDLLGHTADALTAGYHLTNPTPKWRSRLLDLVPANWENELGTRPTRQRASELFWSLHRAPKRPSRRHALQHAFRIATFSRAVFAWAEARLVRGRSRFEAPTSWPNVERKSTDIPLPYLRLDVDFSEHNGRLTIARLNEFDEPVDLSLGDFRTILLFDGLTTVREAEIAVSGVFANDCERRLVDGLISRLARADLCAPLK